jgi:hypothetical protein
MAFLKVPIFGLFVRYPYRLGRFLFEPPNGVAQSGCITPLLSTSGSLQVHEIRMKSKDYLVLVERDASIAAALAATLQTMRFINGRKIEIAGEACFLRQEPEMLRVHHALLLMGVDPNEL